MNHLTPRRPLVATLAIALLTTLPAGRADAQRDLSPQPVSGGGVTSAMEPPGIPPEVLSDLAVRGHEAGLTDGQLEAVTATLHDLVREGLPVGPVLDRIRQGFAKEAPPDRIVAAVDRVSGRIRAGGRLVDAAIPMGDPPMLHGNPDRPEPKPELEARRRLIDQTAFALEQGVPEGTVATLLRQFPAPADGIASGRPGPDPWTARRAPLLALTSLTSEGVPPQVGLAFVHEMHDGGVRGPALEEMGIGLAHAIRSGADPAELRRAIREALDRGVPPGQIVREIRERDRGRPDGPPEGPPGLGPPDDRDHRGGEHDGLGHPPDDPGRRGRRGGPGGGGGTGGGGTGTGGGHGGGGRGGL